MERNTHVWSTLEQAFASQILYEKDCVCCVRQHWLAGMVMPTLQVWTQDLRADGLYPSS